MMQGFGKQEAMLVFRLGTDYHRFLLCILFVGDTNNVFKELLIESFLGRNILDTLYCLQFPDDSV